MESQTLTFRRKTLLPTRKMGRRLGSLFIFIILLSGLSKTGAEPADPVVPVDSDWTGWHRPVENNVFTPDYGNNHDSILFVEPELEYPYHLIISGQTSHAYLWRTKNFSWNSSDWELVSDNYKIASHYEYDDGVKVDGTYYIYEAGNVYTYSGPLEDSSGKWKKAGTFPSGKCADIGVYYEDGRFHIFGEYGNFPPGPDGTSLSHFSSTTGLGDWELQNEKAVDPNPDGGNKYGVGDATIAKIEGKYYLYCDLETKDDPYRIVGWQADNIGGPYEYIGKVIQPRENKTKHWDNYRVQDGDIAYIPDLNRYVMIANMKDHDGRPGYPEDFSYPVPHLEKPETRVVGFFYSDKEKMRKSDGPRRMLKLRTIDDSRVGKAVPDSSAAVDIDRDGQVEILTAMQDENGNPEVLLYERNSDGKWKRSTIGLVERHNEEIEWVAVGQPFPGDSRYCVAAAVQHKKDGLVVFRLREQGLSPFDKNNWEKGVAKDFAGQGLFFRDLDGDSTDELIYATQGGNELGILKAKEGRNHLSKDGWTDYVIDSGNNRAWWWLDGKFYDLNNNGFKNDFFVSTRKYGGRDVGIWKVVQTEPNNLSSYRFEKIYDGNALQIDTGYFFSENRDRAPDIVMVNKPDNHVYLLDARNDYETKRFALDGAAWNVKVLPFLGPDQSRDSFVLATTDSESLFWSFRWQGNAYHLRKESKYAGNYGHPLDGTFTIADVDGDGETECIAPDSSRSDRSKGLGYLDMIPATQDYRENKPADRFKLMQRQHR